ncbi:putative tetratricopeptide-like helical domain superfamily [Dioscorea sansibarensis]
MVKHWTNQRDACCSDTSLVRFYAKCGIFASSRQVFDRMPDRDVDSWAIILMAFVDQVGCENEVMGMFCRDVKQWCHTKLSHDHCCYAMRHIGARKAATFICYAKACYSSLISGYGRNGSADEEIASVFIEMVLCQILQINLPSHHFSFLVLVLDS